MTLDENGRANFGKIEGALQVLIIANLLAFAVETIPDLAAWQLRALEILEMISVIIFSIEYVVRVGFSRPRLGYVFSFMGAIDLLSILPFYLGGGLDLRTMRALRLMRIFRILKLARYSAAARRFHMAFSYAREELVLFGTAALIVLYLASVGIYYFENEAQPKAFSSVFQSMWWALVTLTTVGYGDAIPITLGGRVFTSLILIVGLGIVAVPTGLLAAALARAREQQEKIEKEAKEASEDKTPDI